MRTWKKGKCETFGVNIYCNIKSNHIQSQMVYLFLLFIEVTHYIIVTDIIFTKNRKDINLYFPFYYISPIFLGEALVTATISNCTELNYETNLDYINIDQIALLFKNQLKLPLYENYCGSLPILTFCLCVIGLSILFLLFLGLATSESIYIRPLYRISSLLLYLIYNTFCPLIIYLCIRETSSSILAPTNFIFTPITLMSIIISALYSFMAYHFRKNYNSCYMNNEFIPRKNRKILFILDFISIILNSIIISFKSIFYHSTLFLLSSVALLYLHFAFTIIDYIYSLYRSVFHIGKYRIHLLVFCFSITKIIWVITLTENEFKLVFQIFEILIIFLLCSVIDIIVNHWKIWYPLNSLLLSNTYLGKYHKNVYEGIKELFTPMITFFELNIVTKKNKENSKGKDKLAIVDLYRKILFENYIKEDNDINILDDNIKSHHSAILTFIYSKDQSELNNFSFLIVLLFNAVRNIESVFKAESQSKEIYEAIKVIKIILFFIYDEKPFRAQYFLFILMQSEDYQCSLNYYFLLSYLFNTLYSYSKAEESSMIQIINSVQADEDYLKILKALKAILIELQKGEKERLKIIDDQTKIIGRSYEDIHKIYGNIDQTKINDKYEIEKYKLIEVLLFCKMSHNIIDLLDLPLLENGMNKNTSFVLSFTGHDLFLMKIPARYVSLTGYKSKDHKGKGFNVILHSNTALSTKKEFLKNIFHNSKSAFYLNCLLITKEAYIIHIQLKMFLLPLFGTYFNIIGNIESNAINKNIILIQKNGNIIAFSQFFNLNFALPSSIQKLNAFDLFSIPKNYLLEHDEDKNADEIDSNNRSKEANFDDIQLIGKSKKLKHQSSSIKKENKFKKKYSLTLALLIDNFKSHISNDELSKTQYENVNDLIEQLKDNLSKKKLKINENILNITIQVLKTYTVNNEKQYLIELLFDEIAQDRTQEEGLIDSATHINNHYSSIQTVSGSSVLSVLSTLSSRENAWTITGKRQEPNKIKANSISVIILVFDVFLILVSIIFLLIINITSKTFINSNTIMTNFRDLYSRYYNGHFYLSNLININGVNDISLTNVIPEVNFTLGQLYKYNLNLVSQQLFDSFAYFSNNLSLHFSEEWRQKNFNLSLTLLSSNGRFSNETFLELWNYPKNNFHIIATSEDLSIEIPLLSTLYDILSIIGGLNSNQQIMLSEVYNFLIITEKYSAIINPIEKQFQSDYNTFQIEVYILFTVFLLMHLICFFLTQYGLYNYYQKMVVIGKTITELEPKYYQLYFDKIKLIKQIVKSEENGSVLINRLQSYVKADRKHLNDSKQNQDKINNNNINETNEACQFINEYNLINSQESNNNSSNSVNSTYSLNNKKKNQSYKFESYRYAKNIIGALSSIFVIFAIIAFPLLITFINQIILVEEEAKRINDLQNAILNYYLNIRYCILINSTTLMSPEINFFPNYAKYIYSNFTKFMTHMDGQSRFDEIREYYEKINYANACEIFLDNDDYRQGLLAICNYYHYLSLSFENLLGYLGNKLRGIYCDYNASYKNSWEIIQYFHSPTFIECNYIIIIYILKIIGDSNNIFLIPLFKSTIGNLIVFLIALFSVMVFTEIINFIILMSLGTIKMITSLHHFMLLDKFFSEHK